MSADDSARPWRRASEARLVAEARLVLTDELIREALRRAKKDAKKTDSDPAAAADAAD